ncbi:hypothetical protein GQ600_10960 [Phytophthora cactorum]|nr:hypothetical protein GQ600_10960 [Phytophthora cactorum]
MRCCLNWCRRGQALYDGFPEDDAVGRRGPDKSARYLRGIKEQEEGDSDDMDAEDEARLLSVLNPSTSYLNHPLLRPEAEIVAAAKKADQLLQNRLAKDKAYNYPSLNKYGVERTTQRLYAALYRRQAHSLYPTMK